LNNKKIRLTRYALHITHLVPGYLVSYLANHTNRYKVPGTW